MLKNICAIDQYQCLILALRRVLTIASKICLDNCFAAYYNGPYSCICIFKTSFDSYKSRCKYFCQTKSKRTHTAGDENDCSIANKINHTYKLIFSASVQKNKKRIAAHN